MIFRGTFFLTFFLLFVNGCQVFGQEKKIVVVIPSYNNADWYEKNLDSIFFQNYENFRVIYVDDCSSDGTAQLVQEYLETRGLTSRCVLVKNETRYGPLFNRYKAIHSCQDDEIIVLVDGDDWLKDENVLSFLNYVYSTEDVLLTVGNACKSSSGEKIGQRDYTPYELEQYGIRQLGFRGVHPRTFYAGLFKQIKVQDLMDGGKFLTVATDVAFMLPLFEKARGRYKYIQDILYVYNNENVLNLFKLKFDRQIYFDLITRNRSAHKPIDATEDFSMPEIHTPFSVAHILFVEEETDLSDFIDAREEEGIVFDSFIKIGKSPKNRKKIWGDFFRATHALNVGYSLDQVHQKRFNFKELLLSTVQSCDGDYFLISVEKIAQSKNVNFHQAISQLEKTGAYSIAFGNSNYEILKSHAYDVAPWGEQYGLFLFGKWLYHDVFKDIDDCHGLLFRRQDLIALVEETHVFYPNFYTFLAAYNSVVGADKILLATHTLLEEIPDAH